MSEEQKMNHEEFITKAIQSLRTDKSKGIHTVYSGFNEAFKKYFPGEDPVKVTNLLAEQGKIALRPVKGGVMLYLAGEAPVIKTKGEDALSKILGKS